MNIENVITFKVSRSNLEAMRLALKARGVFQMWGDSGEASYSGVKFSYSYQESEEILTLAVLSKPKIISMSYIRGLLIKWSGLIPEPQPTKPPESTT